MESDNIFSLDLLQNIGVFICPQVYIYWSDSIHINYMVVRLYYKQASDKVILAKIEWLLKSEQTFSLDLLQNIGVFIGPQVYIYWSDSIHINDVIVRLYYKLAIKKL